MNKTEFICRKKIKQISIFSPKSDKHKLLRYVLTGLGYNRINQQKYEGDNSKQVGNEHKVLGDS